MNIGLFSNTHGLLMHRGADYSLQIVPATEMRPVQLAQQAERLGYHSVWFGDHVAIPGAAGGSRVYPGNPASGESPYPPGANMLDAAVVMGAAAVATERIKLASGVLIGPYRGPLNDARQFATVDVLSGGRVILGTGAGWLREEFDALGIPYEARGAMSEECIQIYKRAWTDEVVSFHGEFYTFDNLSMDPKPIQDPHPPIVLGSVSKAGARRAARHCDGFLPEMVDAFPDPDRFVALQDEVRREADRIGRDLSDFTMSTCIAARICGTSGPVVDADPRPLCHGTAEQILVDLERLAAAGYSLVVCLLACPSGTMAELCEQVEWFGREVIPETCKINAAGEWKTDL